MTLFLATPQIEARASALWRRHALSVGFDIEGLLDALNLGLLWDGMEDTVLGALVPTKRLVVLNERRLDDLQRNRGLRRFTVGHEVGHWILHCEDTRAANLELVENTRTLCRQGSREPIEVQAEKFASYLLAPTDQLRARFPDRPWSGWPAIYDLADTFGMSVSAMMVRLEEAGLAHKGEDGQPRSGRPSAPGQLGLQL